MANREVTFPERMRVLLVEDNPADIRMVKEQFRDCGVPQWSCTECVRLEDALQHLALESFDVALLDLNLPDSTGLATFERLHKAFPRVPVVVLTGDKRLALEAMRQGAQDYIAKAVATPELLVRAIRYAIERQRHLEELWKQAAELRRSNQELEQFAFVASHDLQEPLRKIQAFGQQLTELFANQLDDMARDRLNRMVKAAERMAQLIRSLLDYSRVSTRGGAFTDLDLTPIVLGVIKDLEIVIRETGARVILVPLPSVRADGTQMRALFQNLIANALKFRRSGVAPHIAIAPRAANGGWCEISVTDNGIGFDPQQAEIIFQPFARLHGRDEYEGTGMGLAICRKIVQRHGGEISASGKPDDGSTFLVRLPLRERVLAMAARSG
ncbi:MAG: ATP-binding protein [Terriglobales bacterium]